MTGTNVAVHFTTVFILIVRLFIHYAFPLKKNPKGGKMNNNNAAALYNKLFCELKDTVCYITKTLHTNESIQQKERLLVDTF